MEAIINRLLQRFESGSLSRRQLIQGLTMLAGAGAAAPAASAQTRGFQGGSISHVSLSVSDLQRSVDFYQKVFGLAVLSQDKPNEIVRLGLKRTLVSLKRSSPKAVVDHFAIGVENFNRDAVTKDLLDRGVTPSQNVDAGFHVEDPDGYPVQID
jgi:catechol 2,3-dioxygenase-like lactoylglutathione lyase family enzyme